MIYENKLPARVRVLVLGGGIHGVGVLHDMASRGWQDCHLIEKQTLAGATSSKSTKLIHGGLRYLKRISDFAMVREALHERYLLSELAPDLVKPIELFFPIIRGLGTPGWMIKIGLTLYDFLAGKENFDRHKLVKFNELTTKVPLIDPTKFSKVYSFWDGQTDDLALVHRVAASAFKLGAGISEETQALRIWPDQDGWQVEVRTRRGEHQVISALYVINCLGPWANLFLENSHIQPLHRALNNKGVHLILPDVGMKAGMFLQSPDDKRIFFLLPWLGKTLLGTTEELYSGDLDQISIEAKDVEYLLSRCNLYLRQPFTLEDVEVAFAGLRWLAVENDQDISSTSREFVLGEQQSNRGLLVTIYGGKLTSYRSLAEKIGDRITRHFGEYRPSQTAIKHTWATKDEAGPIPDAKSRFLMISQKQATS